MQIGCLPTDTLSAWRRSQVAQGDGLQIRYFPGSNPGGASTGDRELFAVPFFLRDD